MTKKQSIVSELNSYITSVRANIAAKVSQTEVLFADYLRFHIDRNSSTQKFVFESISIVECDINRLKNEALTSIVYQSRFKNTVKMKSHLNLPSSIKICLN